MTTLKADFINSNDFQEYQPNVRVTDDRFTGSMNEEITVFNEFGEVSYVDADDASVSECFSMIPSES